MSCCSREDFLADFNEHYAKWFDAPPTAHAKSMAMRDWRAGNTGWEAAHNAQRRAKDRVRRNLALTAADHVPKHSDRIESTP